MLFRIVKKILKVILIALLVVVLIVGGYLSYAYIVFERLPDNLELDIATNNENIAKPGVEYKIACYNVGYGSNCKDFSFFMDGGIETLAFSKDSVIESINGTIDNIKRINPDIILLQEVDVDARRSYHVDERNMYYDAFSTFNSAYAQNYDSFFLFYPVTDPIGSSVSGMITLSNLLLKEGTRKSLPIDAGFNKFFDLDRCISITRTPVENGKELVIINAHLSAYSKEEGVTDSQLNILKEIMEKEYSDGNYVILGGDLNHDLLEKDTSVISERTWTYPYDRNMIAKGCDFAIDLLAEDVVSKMPKTCRDTNIPYDAAESYTVTADGFIISDNIEMKNYEVIPTDFEYSDHEMVLLTFMLN